MSDPRREAFEKAGYWPNEVLWKVWCQAWDLGRRVQGSLQESASPTGAAPQEQRKPVSGAGASAAQQKCDQCPTPAVAALPPTSGDKELIERACDYLQDLESPFTGIEADELCVILRSASSASERKEKP